MPQGVLQSDIFFFVTTIAVTILTVLAVIIGVYAIKMLRDIRFLVKDLKFRYLFVRKFINHLFKLKK